MIRKLLKSLRKFVCSKLKTYKQSRFCRIDSAEQPNSLQSDPAQSSTPELDQQQPSTSDKPDKPHTKSTSKRRHTIKEIREQNICFNPGEYTKNPFFNFLREYRKTHCGLTIVEQAVQAGAEWRCMTKEQKAKYFVMTDGKPSRRRRYKRKHIYWIKRSKIVA